MKLILLMIMLAAVTLTHAATNAVPSSAEQEQLFMEAVMLSSKGLYAEAEVRLKRLAEVQPNEPTVIEMLRLVQLKLHDPSESLTKKLAATIFPAVQFRAASPQDVIDYLRHESGKFSADKTEVNFVWQVPDSVQLPPITLSLKNIPLSDVLRYVTQLTGLRYRVEPYAVVIYKPDPNVKPE